MVSVGGRVSVGAGVSAPPTVTFSLCVVCLRTDIRDGSVTRSKKKEGEGEELSEAAVFFWPAN